MATLQATGMPSREQLLHLFSQFSLLTSKPEELACLQRDQEAVAITTVIQEEIFQDMGVDPRVGIACLGKVNTVYADDRELMMQFYKFVAKKKVALILPSKKFRANSKLIETELDPDEFAGKMCSQQNLQEKQLEMLKLMRKHSADEQSFILEMLRFQMEHAGFDSQASLLTAEQIHEIAQSRRYGV